MAGNYPDNPSWRFAYDRDGSQGYTIDLGLTTVTQLTTTQMQAINDENLSTQGPYVVSNGGYYMIWFPELRDLDAFMIKLGGGFQTHYYGVEVSPNTTNGLDGTWTSIRTYGDAGAALGGTGSDYRTTIQSITALSIRAVRIRIGSNGNSQGIFSLHLFGEPIPGANPNRLVLWHPTLDQRVGPAWFDWGDTPRSSSADKQFRVKNLSSSLSANSIRVAQEILTDAASGNPSVVGQHTLSTDGATFLAQVNVGTLAPGAISGVVTMRRNTPSNAQLGVWAHRVFAEANSWS